MTDAPESYFESNKSTLRLTVPGPFSTSGQTVPASTGDRAVLRRAQLGAAFAVAAHFSTNQDPALVSMPTGSGKSAVMTLLPFLLGSERVLIVTPSRLLREQLESEFTLLRVLRRAGVIAADLPGPRTISVTKRRQQDSDWEKLRAFDVIIGTPSVLSPAHKNVVPPPPDLFDLLIFDEAHHTPAPTYLELLKTLSDAPVTLVTATPLRRDKQPIPARTVYSYTLTQALADGVLSPIDFLPVDVNSQATAEERDTALAKATITRASSKEHTLAGSRIIARTSSVSHAEQLTELYREHGAPMGLITATTPMKTVRTILRQVEDGTLRGLVSVGVLGEGFDLPRLKVAAYHRPHATLPATLQFLGRITRILADGPTAELLAVKEDVNDETKDLYNSDVAWATLVPAIADAAVADEARRREYLRSFDPEPIEPLSLAGIRPRKDVQVFRTEGGPLDFHTELVKLGDGTVIYQGVDSGGEVLVVVTEHLIRPEWLEADTLDRYGYEIHVAVHDRTHGLVFVHGTRDRTITDLLAALGLDEPRLIDPLWLDRLMNSLAVDNYHSVGMRSARAAGGRLAAYRMMAGTRVGEAVLPSETRSYGTGHGIARVYDPMIVTAAMLAGDQKPPPASITSLGVSYGRAKVFSPDLVGLMEFRDWCFRLAFLAHAAADTTPSGLPGLALLSPRRLEQFPVEPYLAHLETSTLGNGLHVRSTDCSRAFGLEELALEVARVSKTELALRALVDGEVVWTGRQTLTGKVTADNSSDLRVLIGGTSPDLSFSEYLTEFSPTVFYTDGAASIGPNMFQPQPEYEDLGTDVLKMWDFDGVDIRRESDPPREGLVNIKTYTAKQYQSDPDVEFVIDDDRAGEVADLVVIGRQGPDGRREVSLVHCKFTKSAAPGARVGDLYEVAAQASRSVAWLSPSRLARRLQYRLREGSTLLTGPASDLEHLFDRWLSGAGQISWTITIVQPGLLTGKINSSSNIKTILSHTLDNVSQFSAALTVYGHA